MTEKIEKLANTLNECDKESLKQIANTFAKLQRWYVVPWDQLYAMRNHQPVQTIVEEKTSFKVVLVGFEESKKIAVIRDVRAITGLGLAESKKLVESFPQVLKDDASKAEADEISKIIVAAGGKVEIS